MDDTPIPRKCGEAYVNKLFANLVSVPLGMLAIGFFGGLYLVLPYRSKMSDSDLLVFLVLMVPLVVIHEAIHALCALHLGKLHWKDFKFGVHWKALMPYYHLEAPITVKAYRMVTLAPLYVTGTVSTLLFLIHPAVWSALFAGAAIASCIGDVLVFLKLRPFDGNLLVKDSPTEIGCEIYDLSPEGTAQASSEPQESQGERA